MREQNISFEHRSAHDQPDLFHQLATELVDLKVDVIFARGIWALAAAQNATRTVPVVGLDLEVDPVEAGLVASIAIPNNGCNPNFINVDLTATHKFGKWEAGITPLISNLITVFWTAATPPRRRELR